MKIQLEFIDHNELGYEGEVYLEDDRLVADIFVRQYYEVKHGGYESPDEVYHGALGFHVNSVYFVADNGTQINVFSREMEEFIRESIEIEY